MRDVHVPMAHVSVHSEFRPRPTVCFSGISSGSSRGRTEAGTTDWGAGYGDKAARAARAGVRYAIG